MGRRRSQLEVHLDVLRTIKDGTDKPTRIMYGSNLSWQPLKKILSYMISQGLVTEIESGGRGDKRTSKTYKITQKGENVLRYFSRAKELLPLEEIAERLERV